MATKKPKPGLAMGLCDVPPAKVRMATEKRKPGWTIRITTEATIPFGEDIDTVNFVFPTIDSQGNRVFRPANPGATKFKGVRERRRPLKSFLVVLALAAAFEVHMARQKEGGRKPRRTLAYAALGYSDERNARAALNAANSRISKLLKGPTWTQVHTGGSGTSPALYIVGVGKPPRRGLMRGRRMPESHGDDQTAAFLILRGHPDGRRICVIVPANFSPRKMSDPRDWGRPDEQPFATWWDYFKPVINFCH